MIEDLTDDFVETNEMRLLSALRTSLVVDPDNGSFRRCCPRPARAAGRAPRAYTDPELWTRGERCLIQNAFGTSNASPPPVPSPFGGNYYQIVQTPQYVLMFAEWIHERESSG